MKQKLVQKYLSRKRLQENERELELRKIWNEQGKTKDLPYPEGFRENKCPLCRQKGLKYTILYDKDYSRVECNNCDYCKVIRNGMGD